MSTAPRTLSTVAITVDKTQELLGYEEPRDLSAEDVQQISAVKAKPKRVTKAHEWRKTTPAVSLVENCQRQSLGSVRCSPRKEKRMDFNRSRQGWQNLMNMHVKRSYVMRSKFQKKDVKQ